MSYEACLHKLGGNEPGWVYQPHLNLRKCLFDAHGKGEACGSDQQLFYQHTPYANCNVANAFYIATKVPMSLGIMQRSFATTFPSTLENAPFQVLVN